MEDQKQRYKCEYKIRIDTYNQFQERVEKEFIIDFLKNLPIDKLKQLIGFEFINPMVSNENLNEYERERNAYLRSEFAIQLKAEILL